MSTISLEKIYKQELSCVRSMKERGVIQDYKGNAFAGVIWIKADGEWIEVWNVNDVLDSATPWNNA